MAKHTERFDPKSVGPLVEKAKLGDEKAQDQLIYQFQRLVVSLIDVCMTAKYNPNPRGKHVQFLKLFTGGNLQNVAYTIKRQLAMYDLDEVKSAGNVAAAMAIEKCKTNYSSTLVICFAELIKDMIKDGKISHMDETFMSQLTVDIDENTILFNLMVEDMTLEEREWAQPVMEGDKPQGPPPESLVRKMKSYTDTSIN